VVIQNFTKHILIKKLRKKTQHTKTKENTISTKVDLISFVHLVFVHLLDHAMTHKPSCQDKFGVVKGHGCMGGILI
jgi:hypothetical protein